MAVKEKNTSGKQAEKEILDDAALGKVSGGDGENQYSLGRKVYHPVTKPGSNNKNEIKPPRPL